jgi:hypothetical protein
MTDRLEKAERRVAKEAEVVRYVDITDASRITHRVTIGENGRAIGSLQVVPTPETTPATILLSVKRAILLHALWRMENFPDVYPTFRPALIKGQQAGPLTGHDPEVFTQACQELLTIADNTEALHQVYGGLMDRQPQKSQVRAPE